MRPLDVASFTLQSELLAAARFQNFVEPEKPSQINPLFQILLPLPIFIPHDVQASVLGESEVPRRNRPATASPHRTPSRAPSPSRELGASGYGAPRPKTRTFPASHMRRAPSPTPAFNKSAPGKPRWRS